MIWGNRISGKRAHGFALALALVFLVQTSLAASALARTTPQFDIFGNPLCITGPAQGGEGGKSDHDLQHCFTVSCHAGSLASTPPPVGSVPAPQARIIGRLQPSLAEASSGGLHDLASRPRGPPIRT